MTRAAPYHPRILGILRLMAMPCGLFFIGMMMSLGLAGCQKAAPAPSTTAETTVHPDEGPEFRIVSLSPAITDILLDLDLGSFVVGRGAWDEQLDAEIPRVGDLSNLDLEALISLRPTDVILQAGRRGTPAALRTLAEAQGWNIINRQIDSLDDLVDTVAGLVEDLSMGGDAELRARTQLRQAGLLEEFAQAMRPLNEDVTSKWGSVLLLYSTDPPSAFGPGSYLDDILRRMGLNNVLTTGGAWQELDAEMILGLDAEVMVTIRIGSTGAAMLNPDLGALGRLPLAAVRNERCFQVVHPQAHLPGTCVIEVAELLRAIFEERLDEDHVISSETDAKEPGGSSN